MSTTIRFPRPEVLNNLQAETDLVIELVPSGGGLLLGGQASYADLAAWKRAGTDETVYTDVVIEFVGTAQATLGTGVLAQSIGLFGQLPQSNQKFLLGILGHNFNTAVPQVPIISATIGFSQVVCNVAAYDKLSVGGVFGAVAISAGALTVRARPIIKRNYVG